MHDHQPADLDVMGDFAESELHRLAVGEALTEAFTPRDVVLGDLHTALRKTEPTHGMREAGRAEADLRQSQSVPYLHQPVLVVYLQGIVHEFADPAVLVGTHVVDSLHDTPARLFG